MTSLFRNNFAEGKIVVLYGPRQVGKTTIVKEWVGGYGDEVLWINGDELRYRELFERQNSRELTEFVGSRKIVVIDEAQRLPEIGINLKLLIDNNPHIRVIATGSATLDLAQKVSESLTGRKIVMWLYPFSYIEMQRYLGAWEAKRRIEEMLVWGGYPRVVLAKSEEERKTALREIVSSYLYKDILEFEGVRRAEKIVEMLRSLAWQVGSEVSIEQLATVLGMNRATVEKYLDLLEKSFVIFRLSGYARNLRKEIGKTSKYYFWDNGVRNALVEEFKPLAMRGDVGMLWENYLMVERRKWWSNHGEIRRSYFWRTYDQQEIDLVEEGEGMELKAYEFKWQKAKSKVPMAWRKAYPEASYDVVNKDNFDDFLQRV